MLIYDIDGLVQDCSNSSALAVELLQSCINTLRPRQNGRHFPDDIFKCIFLNENVWIPVKISLKYVTKGPINNIPALVQIMAWRRSGDKPLSEPMMVGLPTHICVTRPQWVKPSIYCQLENEEQTGEIWIKVWIFCVKKMNLTILSAIWWKCSAFDVLNYLTLVVTLVNIMASCITWANFEPDLCCHTASLNQNGLHNGLVIVR